jgi:hypothetical protein
VPARHPDRLIKWFIGVVVLGVGVNLLSGLVVAQKWAWLPPVAFVGLLLVAVPIIFWQPRPVPRGRTGGARVTELAG